MTRPKASAPSGRRIGRRAFLGAVPAAVVVGAAAPPAGAQAPPAAAAAAGRGQQTDANLRFGADALKGAEKIAGLEFTDAEEQMMLRGVNRNLESYEALRKLDIPLDTEPAITFRPYLPGKHPPPAGPRAKTLRVSAPARPRHLEPRGTRLPAGDGPGAARARPEGRRRPP